MFARRVLPESYKNWNRRWHAPYGRDLHGERYFKTLLPEKLQWKLFGQFSIQPNNDTRRFEYPWAFEAADLKPGLKVLEIGGGLSGFQFVLAKSGCNVTNVDPGVDGKGVCHWQCDQATMARLNAVFGTDVKLLNTTIDQAGLPDAHFDRIFCISVIEHFHPEEMLQTLAEAARVLKPGGLFILTADLFLDLEPFSARDSNEWGRNVSLEPLLADGRFNCVVGERAEIYGTPEFSAAQAQANLGQLLIGGFYPTLVQCLVLKKRE